MDENSIEKSIKKSEKNVKKITLKEAVKTGNRKKTLIALRDRLAETIENCESGRDMAANTKRLMEVIDELEIIKAAEKEKREKKKAAKQPTKREKLRNLNAR